MNLPIVSFNVAIDLKELGFDWCVTSDFDIYQAEVCKWFRDVHNIHIEIWHEIPKRLERMDLDTSKQWGCGINLFIKPSTVLDSILYSSTYEEAELEGIKAAIKYLKNESRTNN